MLLLLKMSNPHAPHAVDIDTKFYDFLSPNTVKKIVGSTKNLVLSGARISLLAQEAFWAVVAASEVDQTIVCIHQDEPLLSEEDFNAIRAAAEESEDLIIIE